MPEAARILSGGVGAARSNIRIRQFSSARAPSGGSGLYRIGEALSEVGKSPAGQLCALPLSPYLLKVLDRSGSQAWAFTGIEHDRQTDLAVPYHGSDGHRGPSRLRGRPVCL